MLQAQSKIGDTPSRISLAPMMDCTDRHFRYLARLFSKRILLYTEMVVTGALMRGNQERHLQYDAAEHPLALQLGGNDPHALRECAALAYQWGYDEVNLNVGCPSDRVASGSFGACLMAEPDLVADCLSAMSDGFGKPASVKTRIGIDDSEDWEFLATFVEKVRAKGCTKIIIHARKAWLKGLSPKENREKPPLRYDIAARVKTAFPDMEVVLNGGLADWETCEKHLNVFDGVMLGREPYRNPVMMREIDQRFHGDQNPSPSRLEVAEALAKYVERQAAQGVPLSVMTRHFSGLYLGVKGGKAWRRVLGEGSTRSTSSPTRAKEVMRDALLAVRKVETLSAYP
jgi:tRNA-dihydrouridine synthase A